MKFRYNDEKNFKLKIERNIDFDVVINAIYSGSLLDVAEHPNQNRYPNQKIIYVEINTEVYVIPCVEEADGVFFMKTLYASRKARKKFLETKKK